MWYSHQSVIYFVILTLQFVPHISKQSRYPYLKIQFHSPSHPIAFEEFDFDFLLPLFH